MTDNNKPYRASMFGKALRESNKMFAEKMVHDLESIYSWVILLADSRRLPKHVKETERFTELLKASGAKNPERFPVPIMSALPNDIYLWETYIKTAAEDVNAEMFTVITQAYGAKRKLAREVEGKIHELHTEDRDDYALIQVVENGKQVQTFAAPLIMCLVTRQGDYKLKVGDWLQYFNVEKLALPTRWETR